jgi:hypothetical protein
MNNLIKNPILIGFFLATCVFIYLKWKVDKKNKKTNGSKEINLMIPCAVGIVSALFAYYYFNNEQPVQYQPIPQIPQTLGDNLLDSVKSFHLIGRGINMPQKLNGEMFDI